MFALRRSLMLTALTLLTSTVYAQAPAPPSVDFNPQYGWLEGTITTDQGHSIVENNSSNKQIKLVRHGGGAYTIISDPNMGGFYSNNHLKPGVYDVSVPTGYWGNTGSRPYRPQRILGILIRPGQRTLLNIIMPEGETLQETGKPAVVSAPATNVADEIARMQKQIDDLKAQVAVLLKAMPAVPAIPAKP